MAKKNQRNNATTNNTKEEKNMKKNTEIGASVTLTKKGCGTITFVQPNEGDLVSYTVFGVTTKVTKKEAENAIKDFKSDKWKVAEIVEHKASAPTPNYSEIYHQNLDEIQNGKKSTKKEAKVASVKKPTTIKKESNVEVEKKQTYKEVIEKKYGSIEDRRKFAIRRSEVWNEEATKIAEEVKKTGKRLRKEAWKKLMNERVNNRMKAEGFC